MKTKNNNIEYFLYARKSSESEDRQVQSIDDQIASLKELAGRNGLKIKKSFTESKSAKAPNNRPIFNEMIERIKAGEAQGILCWQLNRLSRNPVDSGTLGWLLQNEVIKSIQTIDKEHKSDDNVILFSVETGASNQFIIDLKKNVRRGMNSKAEKGDYPTKPPLGYKNDPVSKKIATDEERLPLVRKMWDMLLSGNYRPPMIVDIANNEWGLRTAKTPKGGNRPLAKSTIYKMFNNIFYTGMFEWKDQIYQGNHKAIITIEEFDKAQKILGKNGKPRFDKHEHAYTGEIFCEECGCQHTATIKTKLLSTGELRDYSYYYCTRKKKTGCSQKEYLDVKELESQIDKVLQASEIHPKFLDWALEFLEERNEIEDENASAIQEQQEVSLARLERQLSKLTIMYSSDLIDEDEFVRTRDELRSQVAKLKIAVEQTKDKASKNVELSKEFFVFATYARARFNNPKATNQEKREIFRGLGWKFTIKDQILNIHKHKWLEKVENDYPALESRYTMLELDKTLDITERSERTDAIRLDWCAYRDSNRGSQPSKRGRRFRAKHCERRIPIGTPTKLIYFIHGKFPHLRPKCEALVR